VQRDHDEAAQRAVPADDVVDPEVSVDTYPTGPYGLGTADVIDKFTFMGFRDGGDPFVKLSLTDFYDPEGTKGIKALFVTLGRSSCGACVGQAGRMETWETKYRSEGLRQLSVLHSGLGVPREATESTARDWIAKYGVTYDVAIDPTFRLNGGVKPDFDPRGWLVDVKTMKIVKVFPARRDS
jgi:hypothetical protein